MIRICYRKSKRHRFIKAGIGVILGLIVVLEYLRRMGSSGYAEMEKDTKVSEGWQNYAEKTCWTRCAEEKRIIPLLMGFM